MRVILLALALAVANAKPASDKINGGSITSIEKYPFAVTMLFLLDRSFVHWCGGTIINSRSILSAAHCFYDTSPVQWRSRVGSAYTSRGGIVLTIYKLINYPHYDDWSLDNDIAIIRINGEFSFSSTVQPGSFAESTYKLADNEVVLAIEWGYTADSEQVTEELRHVQVRTINQEVCASRYAENGTVISNNMLCSGWLDVASREQCHGDSGGPLIHNGVIVGVCSWREGCALPHYPDVNARVSNFASWIKINA